MDLGSFHDTLDNDSDSEKHRNKVRFENPEEILDTLFNSMHSARKTPVIDQGDLISLLENDADQYYEITLSKNSKPLDKYSMINLTEICVQHSSRMNQKFKSTYLDIEAQRSAIGFPQAKAYSFLIETKIKSPESTINFRFGDGCFQCTGNISVQIPTSDFSVIHVNVDIVQPDVSLLSVLDILDKFQLIADNVENELKSKSHG